MDNYFDGFEIKEVTLISTQDVKKGEVVEFLDSYTVDKSHSGVNFIGVCTYAHKYNASVQLKGYTKVKYTGTAPQCGYEKLVGDGNGGVKVADNGRYILVTDVDYVNGICGIIL